MKYLFVALAFISAFLIGCDDNPITDPVSSTLNKGDVGGETEIRGILPLDKMLVVPGLGNEYYQLNSKITYTEKLLKGISTKSISNSDIKVKLATIIDGTLTNTELKDPDHNQWKIYSESGNTFYINPEGIKMLEVTYPVLHRTDEMQLVCTFIVTPTGITIDDVHLKIPQSQKAR